MDILLFCVCITGEQNSICPPVFVRWGNEIPKCVFASGKGFVRCEEDIYYDELFDDLVDYIMDHLEDYTFPEDVQDVIDEYLKK